MQLDLDPSAKDITVNYFARRRLKLAVSIIPPMTVNIFLFSCRFLCYSQCTTQTADTFPICYSFSFSIRVNAWRRDAVNAVKNLTVKSSAPKSTTRARSSVKLLPVLLFEDESGSMTVNETARPQPHNSIISSHHHQPFNLSP